MKVTFPSPLLILYLVIPLLVVLCLLQNVRGEGRREVSRGKEGMKERLEKRERRRVPSFINSAMGIRSTSPPRAIFP
jgi:hypothetical protein